MIILYPQTYSICTYFSRREASEKYFTVDDGIKDIIIFTHDDTSQDFLWLYHRFFHIVLDQRIIFLNALPLFNKLYHSRANTAWD